MTGLLYSGADIIRRKFTNNNNEISDESSRLPARNQILLSRQEKRALGSLRLMEKVESIGLENIMSSSYHTVGLSPLAIRTRTTSPMTQLTSLKNISQQQHRNNVLFSVDRQTIKSVLNKGLSNESLLSDTTATLTLTSSPNLQNSFDDTVTDDKKVYSVSTRANPIENKTQPNQTVKTPQKFKQMQRQKSRRNLIVGGIGQRPDLGKVLLKNDSHSHSSNDQTQKSQLNDCQNSIASLASQQSYTQSFVGSISSLFFGRKGGFL